MDGSLKIFYVPVSTKLGVEIFMAAESKRGVVLVDHSDFYTVQGESSVETGIDLNIDRPNREDPKDIAEKALLDLWNFVCPHQQIIEYRELTEKEKRHLTGEINSKRKRKVLDPYITFQVPQDIKDVFASVAKMLCEMVPEASLAAVAFDPERGESALVVEEYLASAIKGFYEEIENSFQS